MSVRCGYCGEEHPSAEDVKDCALTGDANMRFLRRQRPKLQLHPVNQAAMKLAEENMARIEAMRKEPRDVRRNLDGIERARAALHTRGRSSAA